VSLFKSNPQKSLDRARDALAAAEQAATDAAAAFEADPTPATATGTLIADQRLANARKAVASAEQEVADARRADLRSELDALLKEIGPDAVAAFREAEVERETQARAVLQDAWLAAEVEARERNFRCNRARQIATELGQSTAEIDGAQSSWRSTADVVAEKVTERLATRTATLPGDHAIEFLRRAVSWTAPTLRR